MVNDSTFGYLMRWANEKDAVLGAKGESIDAAISSVSRPSAPP
jgi:hypothetical protein